MQPDTDAAAQPGATHAVDAADPNGHVSRDTAAVRSRQPGAQARLAYLDGLRGLACLFVVAHHFYLGAWHDGRPDELMRMPNTPFMYGHYAVTVFIVLSGFCIMMPIARQRQLLGGTLRFLARRSWRILPPYFAALGLSYLVFAALPGRQPISHSSVMAHLFLWQDIRGDDAPNGALWSISVEWRIYFVFALLLLPVWWRAGTGVACAVGMGMALAIVPLSHRLHWWWVGACPYYVGLFALGMAAADLAVRGYRRWWTREQVLLTAAVFSLCVVIAVCSRFGYVFTSTHFGFTDALVGLATTCLLLAAYPPSQWSPAAYCARALSTPLLVSIGVWSYSIYLMHAPLVELYYARAPFVSAIHDRWLLFGLSATIGIPVVVALLFVFYWVVERPAMLARKALRI